jgi:hypothetical protein
VIVHNLTGFRGKGLQTIKENQLNGLCTNFVDDGIT